MKYKDGHVTLDWADIAWVGVTFCAYILACLFVFDC